jgi:hypothetical protein
MLLLMQLLVLPSVLLLMQSLLRGPLRVLQLLPLLVLLPVLLLHALVVVVLFRLLLLPHAVPL